jgi:membrane-bound lytic murein transglycosylase B
MISRRNLLAVAGSTALLAGCAIPPASQPAAVATTPAGGTPADLPVVPAGGNFSAFVAGVRVEAMRKGISAPVLDAAFAGVQPNRKVIELDSRQPEFTMTWQHYRDTRLSAQRVAAGRRAWADNRQLLAAIAQRFGVDPRVVVGIWGLETNYGTYTGGFHVVEALATLAWDGRRTRFFRSELLDSLTILQDGDITPPAMTGSYAGAMGQPQFMPSSYLRYAVDFDGDGKRDIWTSVPDSLASIANYLAKSGWRGEGWGTEVRLPPGFNPAEAGRAHRRPVSAWAREGVTRADGRPLRAGAEEASIVLPAGAGGQAFIVYPNYMAIRRYNPSDFYALSVGLLGNLVSA